MFAQDISRCFWDLIWVSRIENRVPRISENYHWVFRIRENQDRRIREIGSLQVYTRYLTFFFKKNLICLKSITVSSISKIILTAWAKSASNMKSIDKLIL